MAHVAPQKKETVKEFERIIKGYPVVALLDIKDIPASTMQEMREKLRSHAKIIMTKKRLMRIIFKNLEPERKNIQNLENHFRGMPALLLTKENPFKIASLLRKSRTAAYAKAGQAAPADIIIKKGPTPFAPGPIISELGGIGIKTGVEAGKVAVKDDSTVAKKGDIISQKVADVLVRLDIKPMEIGLAMTAAHENGIIYSREVLNVDEAEYLSQLRNAAFESFAVAMHAGIITEETIMPMLSKSAREAFALSVHLNILTSETAKFILGKAHTHGTHIKNKIGI